VASIIKPKRSSTPGTVPAIGNLADGEIAINTADKIIYQRVGAVVLTVANYGTGANAPSISNQITLRNDCFNTGNDSSFFFTASGTGAAFNGQATGTDNAAGMLRIAMGTVATNRAAIHSNVYTIINFGKGVKSRKDRVRFATNTYSFRSGFIDSITGESVDCASFRYSHSVNAGKFQAVTRSNNVETAVDTGITVAINTFYVLEVIVNELGTSVQFKINNVVVATITTNIPSGAGRDTGYGLMVLRSVGTAAFNSIDIDYLETELNFTTQR
jgi:hypothetical protein